MTPRPDVFGLARELRALCDGFAPDFRLVGNMPQFEIADIATALLALEPVWQAAQECREVRRRADAMPTPDMINRHVIASANAFRVLFDEVDTARAALGREGE